MRTPAQPAFAASALKRTLSGIAHVPVPGMSALAGTPPAMTAARRSERSATDIEFASEFVPKMASPTLWACSQRQKRTKRSVSGARFRLNGVRTGASTPGRTFSKFIFGKLLRRHRAGKYIRPPVNPSGLGGSEIRQEPLRDRQLGKVEMLVGQELADDFRGVIDPPPIRARPFAPRIGR